MGTVLKTRENFASALEKMAQKVRTDPMYSDEMLEISSSSTVSALDEDDNVLFAVVMLFGSPEQNRAALQAIEESQSRDQDNEPSAEAEDELHL